MSLGPLIIACIGVGIAAGVAVTLIWHAASVARAVRETERQTWRAARRHYGIPNSGTRRI